MAAPTVQQPSSPPAGLSRWTPSLPTGLITMLNPFASENSPKTPSDLANAPDARPAKRLAFAQASGPPSPSKSDMSIMFAEPDTRSTSEADSREGSIDGAKRSKKNNRQKTRFSVCHAPPTSATRQKLHRRPRSLLQLHKLSPNARPQPALEVVPSANFSVRLTKELTKTFKARHSLCPNDLVVLRCEKYSTGSEDEDSEAKQPIGLICKGRKEDNGVTPKAKICFMDGKEWDAYPLPNGGYEFATVDEHGLNLTARWVLKKAKDTAKSKDRKFNFSTISPNTRRHPVIASISQNRLEVNDTFKLPEPSSATPLATPRQNSTILADAMDDDCDSPGQQVCKTDDALRELIAMTGIWVTFKEGWSPTFRYDDKDCPLPHRVGSLSNSPVKSTASLVSTPPGSPRQLPVALDKRSNSLKSISSGFISRGKGSLSRRAVRSSTMSSKSIEEDRETESINSDQPIKTGRSRADSNSTVLVHRAASNRRKNHHQAVWRPDLLNAQQSVNERSREPSQDDTRSSVSPRASPSPSPVPEQRSTPVVEPQDKSELRKPKPLDSSSNYYEKRESTATTDTHSSSAPKARNGAAVTNGVNGSAKKGFEPTKKKARGWRKLLCGSSEVA